MPKKSSSRKSIFQRQLLRWYATAGRVLPWRQTRDPYAIVVSEVMLQQTQVSRGLPKFLSWMKRFPNTRVLAQAPLSAVLKEWQGLGYNRRAKYLWLLAKTVEENYDGKFPRTKEEILKLPGVGPHTAGAVMSFAFGATEPIFDTNAQRVVGRVFKGYKKLPALSITDWQQLMSSTIPTAKNIFNFNQALMDLGALICTAKKPDCEHCPLNRTCVSYPAILTATSQELRLTPLTSETLYFGQPRRIWRGKILRYVHTVAPRPVSLDELGKALQIDWRTSRLAWLRSVVQLLAQEGLVKFSGHKVSAE